MVIEPHDLSLIAIDLEPMKLAVTPQEGGAFAGGDVIPYQTCQLARLVCFGRPETDLPSKAPTSVVFPPSHTYTPPKVERLVVAALVEDPAVFDQPPKAVQGPGEAS